MARPSRDLLIAAHQQVTHEWWQVVPLRFELWVSEFVLEEIRKGDPEAAAQRLALVEGLPILRLTEEARALIQIYLRRSGLHPDARVDLAHIALTVVHEIDCLVTWNCAHIANPQVVRRLAEVNREMDLFMPLILTPEAFLELL